VRTKKLVSFEHQLQVISFSKKSSIGLIHDVEIGHQKPPLRMITIQDSLDQLHLLDHVTKDELQKLLMMRQIVAYIDIDQIHVCYGGVL